MNQQYTYPSQIPVNMDRVPLTNQAPNTHLVAGAGAGAPPSWKPSASASLGAFPNTGPAQQANHRNGPRAAQRDRHTQRHKPTSGKMTLPYLHESTTSIHDRLSGWQGPPPSIKEKEDEMKREAERLVERIEKSS